MSSVPHPTPAATPAPPARSTDEITIISHSNLYYWWPVWAVGFLMGILTWFSGYVMAVVPSENDRIIPAARLDIDYHGEKVEGIILEPKPGKQVDKKRDLLPRSTENPDLAVQPKLHIAESKLYGVVYAFVLLMVIVITNVPLRGMWSVMVILLVVLLIVIFAAWRTSGNQSWT